MRAQTHLHGPQRSSTEHGHSELDQRRSGRVHSNCVRVDTTRPRREKRAVSARLSSVIALTTCRTRARTLAFDAKTLAVEDCVVVVTIGGAVGAQEARNCLLGASSRSP